MVPRPGGSEGRMTAHLVETKTFFERSATNLAWAGRGFVYALISVALVAPLLA